MYYWLVCRSLNIPREDGSRNLVNECCKPVHSKASAASAAMSASHERILWYNAFQAFLPNKCWPFVIAAVLVLIIIWQSVLCPFIVIVIARSSSFSPFRPSLCLTCRCGWSGKALLIVWACHWWAAAALITTSACDASDVSGYEGSGRRRRANVIYNGASLPCERQREDDA